MNSFDENAYGSQPGDGNPQYPPQQPGTQPGAAGNVPPQAGAAQGGNPHYQSSPYESSPYMMNHSAPNSQPNQGPEAWAQGGFPPQKPEKPKKPRKKCSPWGRRVIACVLVLVLVAAGCGITAVSLNNHWSNDAADLRQEYEAQIDTLQKQVDTLNRTAGGTSVSGSPVAAEGLLTPSQVYARNVRSVVSISSTMAPNRMGQVGKGSGSGFILTEDGYVVTNYHVIEGAAEVSVILYDKSEYPAKVIGSDVNNDVAVLKIEGKDLPAVTLGSSSDLLIGDMVVAIGNPLGMLAATQTDGYLCGKDRNVTTGGAYINMLQTDAAINAGNSGGPLFNMKGEVVGITSAKYSGTTGSGASIEGIGFAIPIDDVMDIVDDLVQLGYVSGAYLGITLQEMDPEAAARYNLPVGPYVVSVVEDGSADRAGIQPKDIIIQIGEYKVTNYSELARALRHFEAGDTTTITYVRGGATHEASITLDERPKDLNAPKEPEQPMPSEGDYDEWFDYFNHFFGDVFGEPRP